MKKNEVASLLFGGGWQQIQNVPPFRYLCGFCNSMVSSEKGWQFQHGSSLKARIYICPFCISPTVFNQSNKSIYPTSRPGNEVGHVPNKLYQLYNEARDATSAGAFTAAVMACRKMLMNIAVEKGAVEGESFASYVDHLMNNGYLPPGSDGWVDQVRRKGNEANHEIALMNEGDAKLLVGFIELLLKFIFELPGLVPQPTPTEESSIP